MIFGHVNDLDTSFAWLPQHIGRRSNISNAPISWPCHCNLRFAGQRYLRSGHRHDDQADCETRPTSSIASTSTCSFFVQGREKIGVASDTGRNLVAEDLLGQRDLLFYAGMENESTLTMTPKEVLPSFCRVMCVGPALSPSKHRRRSARSL